MTAARERHRGDGTHQFRCDTGKGPDHVCPRPTFFDQALSFTAILHRPTSVASFTSDSAAPVIQPAQAEPPPALQAVLAALNDGPQSLANLADRLHLSEPATRNRLDRLRRDGRIRIVGGRGTPTTYERIT
jgi:Winged helix-turn-helix DNA-binding